MTVPAHFGREPGKITAGDPVVTIARPHWLWPRIDRVVAQRIVSIDTLGYHEHVENVHVITGRPGLRPEPPPPPQSLSADWLTLSLVEMGPRWRRWWPWRRG